MGIISSLTANEAKTAEVMDSVNEFVATASIPPELANRLRAYFRHQHATANALTKWHGLLDELSPVLRGDVAFAVNASWIRRILLFRAVPASMLIELSMALRPISFPPGECLLSRGDDAATASIMVLSRGVVRLRSPDLDGERLQFACRSRGGVLGSASADGLVNIWDAARARAGGSAAAGAEADPALLFQHAGHAGQPVVDFHWSPAVPWTCVSVSDNATGGGTVQVWRISDLLHRSEAEVLAELEQHREAILAARAAAAPDAPDAPEDDDMPDGDDLQS